MRVWKFYSGIIKSIEERLTDRRNDQSFGDAIQSKLEKEGNKFQQDKIDEELDKLTQDENINNVYDNDLVDNMNMNKDFDPEVQSFTDLGPQTEPGLIPEDQNNLFDSDVMRIGADYDSGKKTGYGYYTKPNYPEFQKGLPNQIIDKETKDFEEQTSDEHYEWTEYYSRKKDIDDEFDEDEPVEESKNNKEEQKDYSDIVGSITEDAGTRNKTSKQKRYTLPANIDPEDLFPSPCFNDNDPGYAANRVQGNNKTDEYLDKKIEDDRQVTMKEHIDNLLSSGYNLPFNNDVYPSLPDNYSEIDSQSNSSENLGEENQMVDESQISFDEYLSSLKASNEHTNQDTNNNEGVNENVQGDDKSLESDEKENERNANQSIEQGSDSSTDALESDEDFLEEFDVEDKDLRTPGQVLRDMKNDDSINNIHDTDIEEDLQYEEESNDQDIHEWLDGQQVDIDSNEQNAQSDGTQNNLFDTDMINLDDDSHIDYDKENYDPGFSELEPPEEYGMNQSDEEEIDDKNFDHDLDEDMESNSKDADSNDNSSASKESNGLKGLPFPFGNSESIMDSSFDNQMDSESGEKGQSSNSSNSTSESQNLEGSNSNFNENQNEENIDSNSQGNSNDKLGKNKNSNNEEGNSDADLFNQLLMEQTLSKMGDKAKDFTKPSEENVENGEGEDLQSDQKQENKENSSDKNNTSGNNENSENKNDAKQNESSGENKEDNSDELTEEEKKNLRDILDDKSKLDNRKKMKLLNKSKKYLNKKMKQDRLNGPKGKVELSDKEKMQRLQDFKNKFTGLFEDLPSFEQRNRGDGYSIDTVTLEEVPNSVIKTLVEKFLNQQFCKKDTDLNVRSNNLEETDGFHKWKIKDVIVHLETEQVTKVLTDKVGYSYAEGEQENIPLSFYFDMSGSMSKYTAMLATVAIELIKKDVKVLIGFNQYVHVQIDEIDKDIDTAELAEVLENAGDYDYECGDVEHKKVKYKDINENIDDYLIRSKAEKCVIFSDFDPRAEVINLSQKAKTYWFCFEWDFGRKDLSKYQGFIYQVQNINDIARGLIKVGNKRFETLCFTENPTGIGRRRR